MKRTLILAAVASAVTSCISAAQPTGADPIPLDSGWQTYGPSVAVRDGVLEIGNGGATRRDVALRDGTIELDVELSGRRSFVYLQFRMEDDENHEELYLRPHKSELPDAIQYSPVFHGISNWQLYHGPGYTAATELPAGQWIHLRLVIAEAHAALFVGEGEQPDLVIPLVREPRAGYIGLRSFVPGGDSAWSARFRNLTIQPGARPIDLRGVEQPAAAPPGTIGRWDVSDTFVPAEGRPIEAMPAEIASGPWSELATEPSGLLLMSRYRGRPTEADQWAVLARTTLSAGEPRTQRLELGYSDEVSVFLNGRLLFVADDSYSFDRPRREGLIGFDQAALYLPLGAGANELVLAVKDRFGGWGFMARLP